MSNRQIMINQLFPWPFSGVMWNNQRVLVHVGSYWFILVHIGSYWFILVQQFKLHFFVGHFKNYPVPPVEVAFASLPRFPMWPANGHGQPSKLWLCETGVYHMCHMFMANSQEGLWMFTMIITFAWYFQYTSIQPLSAEGAMLKRKRAPPSRHVWG